MDLAVKKIELINWLTQQDEEMIKKIDALRQSSIRSAYEKRMKADTDSSLEKSDEDIKSGRIHAQENVEAYFRTKFKK